MTRLRYRIALIFYAGASVFMIGWTVLLLLTLPSRYLAGQWRVAWTGFDLALVLLLAAMAWAAWRRRTIMPDAHAGLRPRRGPGWMA